MIYQDRIPDSMVQNIFGEWIDPSERGPAPCIHIPVTPEMRAREAARHIPPPSDWKLKAMLSVDNLREPARPICRPRRDTLK